MEIIIIGMATFSPSLMASGTLFGDFNALYKEDTWTQTLPLKKK